MKLIVSTTSGRVAAIWDTVSNICWHGRDSFAVSCPSQTRRRQPLAILSSQWFPAQSNWKGICWCLQIEAFALELLHEVHVCFMWCVDCGMSIAFLDAKVMQPDICFGIHCSANIPKVHSTRIPRWEWKKLEVSSSWLVLKYGIAIYLVFTQALSPDNHELSCSIPSSSLV